MKKSIIRAISLCLNLWLFLCLPSQTLAAGDTCPEIYSLDNTLKNVLDNGMTVVIHEMRKAPIVAINLVVKTGSATEGAFAGSGMTHLTEHMLFKSKGEKSEKSLTEKIKSFGGDINAFTSRDNTAYVITVPREYALEAIKILRDAFASPDFDALELKSEKDVILDEMKRNRDNPARYAFDLAWELIFRNHPYKYPIIGYEDLFDRVAKKDLEEYHSARYSPHNMVLGIAGDVDKAAFFNDVEDIFGPLKRNFVPAYPVITEPPQLIRQERTEYRPVSLAHVLLSYRSASINDSSLYPLDILATALGEGEDSILTKVMRDEKKLVYQISCQNYTLRDSGVFAIYFTADPLNAHKAVDAVLEVIEKTKKEGMSSDELTKTKNIAEAQILYALETAEGRARDIATSEAVLDVYNFSQIYLSKLREVTKEEVTRVAEEVLNVNKLNSVIITPEELREGRTSSETAHGFSRKVSKDILPNGIKILVSEDHSAPLCSISAIFLGGVRAEDEKNNGITYLVSKLLLDGTETRGEEDIKREIESRGGSIESINGNNSFGVTANLLSRDWEKGIEIISDIIMNSEFSLEKIEKEKRLGLAAIKERDDSITGSRFLLFKQNFFGEHPYRLDALGAKDTLQNITREEIADYYDSLGVPANMIFAVVGDVDYGKVLTELKKRFGAFEGREPKLPQPPAPEPLKNKKEITSSMEREQSLVIVGFPSAKLADNDRYAFEVISSIMSGSSGRMLKNIRDKLGIAYALGSNFMPGLEGGCHIFFALTAAQNIKSARDAVINEVEALKGKTIEESELEAAKRYLIASRMAGMQRNSAFALDISLDELYGLGYDNFENYSAMIEGVSAGQVKRVANQYFNTKNCLVVIVYGQNEGEGEI